MHNIDNTTVKGATTSLVNRAVRVARALRATGNVEFHHRHDTPEQWNRWARRARVARTVASAFQLPADSVTVTNDPDRQYRTRNGNVPGDLITVTDPVTGQEWRLLTDFTGPGESWFVLAPCPGCEADVPVVRIACLADLGDYLDPDSDLVPTDEARDASLHRADCVLALQN